MAKKGEIFIIIDVKSGTYIDNINKFVNSGWKVSSTNCTPIIVDGHTIEQWKAILIFEG